MAKVKVFGNAAVVTSTLKLAEIEKVQNSTRRDALTLKGGDDGKTPVFCVCASKHGRGDINNVGAEFANASRDENGYAQITLDIPTDVADAKEYVAKKYGVGLTNLSKLEEALPEVIATIEAEHAALLETIEAE